MDYENEVETEDEQENEAKVPLDPRSVLAYAAEGRNIAELVDDGELAEIGQKVLEDYKKDLESRAGWTDSMTGWIDLALQVKEEKSYPWDGASNVKFPLATVSVIQFASRISPAIIRMPYPVTGRVNGYQTQDKLEAAKRIGMHMSWQLTDEMDGWVDDQDTLFHVLPITGCAFKKTYYDAWEGRPVSELVMPDRLVFDYYAKSVEDARTVTHIYTMHEQIVLSKQRMGVFRDVEIAKGGTEDGRYEERDKVNETDHTLSTKDRQYTILEQHTWLDLDDDDLEEPYIVTVCEESATVLRIEPRFVAERVYINPDGEVAAIDAESFFTQYVFLPDPSGGNLGLGWGRILGPINESVNTAINQLIDNGTLNNLGGGFIDKMLKIPGGEIHRTPGEWLRVEANGSDLRNGIMPWPTSEPSQVLYQLLTLLINWGQRITAVTDSMSGEIPAANVPATTTLAMLEQGQKVFQGIYARIYRSLARELKKLKTLNARYMGDEEYFRVLDGGSAMVTRNDYNLDETDITLTAEQTLPSEQVAMARIRLLFEAANAGMNINPEALNRLVVQALGEPPEAAPQYILPPQPDPMAEIKAQEVQGRMQNEQTRNQLESERLALENRRIDSDNAEKVTKLTLERGKNRMQNMIEAAKLGQQNVPQSA